MLWDFNQEERLQTNVFFEKNWEEKMGDVYLWKSWTRPIGSGVQMPLIDTHIFAVLPITLHATVPKA